jgi:GDP-4-dehydro-6-deoxy-D-mannose reductase
MRALITGIAGFVGGHLSAHLSASGATVLGVDRAAPKRNATNEAVSPRVWVGDLLDESFVQEALRESNPSHVFHLAGILSGAPGGGAAQYMVNVLGTVSLLNSLKALNLRPWVLIASSSAVYGVPQHLPIDESLDLRPITDYAASKAAQEMVAIQSHLGDGLPVVRTRTFNMIGAGQAMSLLTSNLARQVAEAEKGGPRVLRIGNLTPRRDYTDIRDVVRAYALLAGNHAGEVFNVCSGVSHSVQEAVDLFVKMSRVSLTVEVDSSRIRQHEIDEQVGDARRLREATGWQPTIPFTESLRELLEYYRQELRNGEN